jgi:hypothetical protein
VHQRDATIERLLRRWRTRDRERDFPQLLVGVVMMHVHLVIILS